MFAKKQIAALTDEVIDPYLKALSANDRHLVIQYLVVVASAINKQPQWWPGWGQLDFSLDQQTDGNHLGGAGRLVLLKILKDTGFEARIEADPNDEHRYDDNPRYEIDRMQLNLLWLENDPEKGPDYASKEEAGEALTAAMAVIHKATNYLGWSYKIEVEKNGRLIPGAQA